MLVAYDIKTGRTLWSFAAVPEGFESYYPYTPMFPGCIADGKIYMYSSEHSPSTPLRRDAYLWCINLDNGQLLWKIQHWGSSPAIADGYLVDLNLFDNQIYCYGKGPSATTVSAPDTVIPLGTQVLIKGTVTDQTPSDQAKGTPAMSDADQESWMEYLYQQRPKPTSATGVPVTLQATGSNGNTISIGTVTSDFNGQFKITWTPPSNDLYTITASFSGSKSYGASSAETSIAVAAASFSSFAPLDLYIIIATIVILIAIAIAVIVLRKRP